MFFLIVYLFTFNHNCLLIIERKKHAILDGLEGLMFEWSSLIGDMYVWKKPKTYNICSMSVYVLTPCVCMYDAALRHIRTTLSDCMWAVVLNLCHTVFPSHLCQSSVLRQQTQQHQREWRVAWLMSKPILMGISTVLKFLKMDLGPLICLCLHLSINILGLQTLN